MIMLQISVSDEMETILETAGIKIEHSRYNKKQLKNHFDPTIGQEFPRAIINHIHYHYLFSELKNLSHYIGLKKNDLT